MFSTFWQEAWPAEIVNHLWQSTLVVFVAWLLVFTLKRYQARTRYWVWMAGSLKFLFPFSMLTALGRWLRLAAVSPIEGVITHTLTGVEQPFATAVQMANSFTLPLAEPPSGVSAPHNGFSVLEALLALWLCGMLFVLFRWLRNWLEIRSIVRAASPEPSQIDVPVFVTSHRIEPGVVGLFRPVLLLPAQILERLPKDQLRAILAHERCHIQRRDNLTGAVHMLVETIFWFHPAVWWLERRLVEERERACDESVLQLGNEAEVYAESILNVCKSYTESPIVCVSGVTGSELKQRILRIMTAGAASRLDAGRKCLLSVVAALVMALPVVSGLKRPTEVRAQAKPAVSSQKIAATWQGTLHTNMDYRFVVQIAAAEDGSLKYTFYNLSGQPGGLPGFSTGFDGSLLKIDLGFATYEGTLSADGNSITGRWRQGADSQPLIFLRAKAGTEWTIPQPPPRPAPMAADADPEFEVSTIKPSTPEEHGPRYMFEHRRFSVVHITLNQLVQFAYGVQENEIEKAPDWFHTEAYDIAAQPGGEGEPSIRQWQTMVKKLMADRFHLKFHTEKRELSVYALSLAKTGPKFAKSHGDPNGQPGLGFGPGNMGATNATMAEIAEAMQQGAVDRPVVDQTGLAGRFDLRLRWTPDDIPADAQNADAPPDLFTAMQEQLGLKLLATKVPVDVIMIDRVERPSAN